MKSINFPKKLDGRIWRRFLFQGLVLAFLIALIGCGAGAYERMSGDRYKGGSFGDMEYAGNGFQPEGPPSVESSVLRAEASSDSDLYFSESEDQLGLMSNVAVEKPEVTQSRMRIYNGEARLVVENPQETQQRIESRLEEWGGYIESAYGEVLILRVPAESFYRIFDELLAMGRVLDQRIETWDITDFYQDLQGRLSLAQETRQRLYRLLEQSSDPLERSKILREIGRLTEEIEQIRLNMESLANRASLSRITLYLQPRLAREQQGKDQIPFWWIANLNPLYPVGGELKAQVQLDLGPSFAVFEDSSYYLAETPEGVIFRVSTLDNRPEGDEAFWQQALLFHLEDYYKETQAIEIPWGEKTLPGVRFISKDREPYAYNVAIWVEGKKIHLIELFLPDPQWDTVTWENALNEGEIR